jgi:hypothetical protein
MTLSSSAAALLACRPVEHGSAARELDSLLAHRRWVRRALPFPHVVATDVFTEAFYAELAADFAGIMDAGAVVHATTPGYEARSARLAAHSDGPLGIFLSRGWHDLVSGVAGVSSATGDVSGALHHHGPGGSAGWPHNDLNPGWFAGPAPGPDEIRVEGLDGVDYHRGPGNGSPARETIRAVSVLYYLANPEWAEGDGGETGLFASDAAGAQGEGSYVPPLNNSLVLFECTPFSWHAYAGASRHERNCVVMWAHRSRSEVVERWGESSVVHW